MGSWKSLCCFQWRKHYNTDKQDDFTQWRNIIKIKKTKRLQFFIGRSRMERCTCSPRYGEGETGTHRLASLAYLTSLRSQWVTTSQKPRWGVLYGCLLPLPHTHLFTFIHMSTKADYKVMSTNTCNTLFSMGCWMKAKVRQQESMICVWSREKYVLCLS